MTQPQIPTTPGLCQMIPRTPQQQVPTPRRQEATQVMPYRCAAPKPSTTPSASQGGVEPAREDEGARGRSSSRGPQDRQ